MSEYEILFTVELGPGNAPTGRTIHHAGSTVFPKPHALAIVQYPGDQGCYLLYLDDAGEEQTDTYHDSPAAAMAQAAWEFTVEPHEWKSTLR